MDGCNRVSTAYSTEQGKAVSGRGMSCKYRNAYVGTVPYRMSTYMYVRTCTYKYSPWGRGHRGGGGRGPSVQPHGELAFELAYELAYLLARSLARFMSSLVSSWPRCCCGGGGGRGGIVELWNCGWASFRLQLQLSDLARRKRSFSPSVAFLSQPCLAAQPRSAARLDPPRVPAKRLGAPSSLFFVTAPSSGVCSSTSNAQVQ